MRKLGMAIFFLLLLYTPVAFLINSPLADLVLITLCYTSFLFTHAVHKKNVFQETPLGKIGSLLILFVFLQCIPLPPPFLKWHSPNLAEVYARTIWLVEPDAWMPISVDLQATITMLSRMLSCALLFMATIQILQDRKTFKNALYLISVICGFAAMFAILSMVGSRAGGESTDLALTIKTTTFIHEMMWQAIGGIVVMTPLVWCTYRVVWMSVKELLQHDEVLPYLTIQNKYGYLLLRVVIFLAMAAVFVSGSLIAFVAVFLSFFVSAVLLLAKKNLKFQSPLLSFTVLVLGIAAYLISFLQLQSVFVWSNTHYEKLLSLRSFVDYLKTSPLFGVGLGNFSNIHNYYVQAYEHYPPVDFLIPHLIQFSVDMGLTGTGLLLFFIFVLLYKSYSILQKRNRQSTTYILVGTVTGIVMLCLSGITGPGLSLGNFMYITAIFSAFLFVVQDQHATHQNNVSLKPLSQGNTRSRCLVVTFMVTTMIIFHAGEIVGSYIDLRTDTQSYSLSEGETSAGNVQLEPEKSTLFAPFNSQLHVSLGDRLLAKGLKDDAKHKYIQAVRLAPLSGRNLSRLSLAYELSGEKFQATELLDTAKKLSFPIDDYHRRLLLKLLATGDLEAGKLHMRTAVSKDVDNVGDYLGMLRLYDVKDEDLSLYLPEMWQPHLALGNHLFSAGNMDAARQSYRDATTYAMRSESPVAEPFIHVIGFYLQEADYNEALKLAIASLDLISDNADLHYLAAICYENTGIRYRAIEEYRIALLLNSEHPGASQRLQELKSRE